MTTDSASVIRTSSLAIFFLFIAFLILYSWEAPILTPLGGVTDRTLGMSTGDGGASTTTPD